MNGHTGVALVGAQQQHPRYVSHGTHSLLEGESIVSDWLLNLPVLWMAVVVFAATYLLAAGVFWVVTRLAVNDRARAFKAVSPGMLPPLGILFALLVGFIAVEVWNNYEKAKVSVATEASALRAVVLLAGTLPEEQKTRIYALIDRHIEVAVNEGWPAMARHSLTLSTLPTALTAALHETLTLKPADDSQRTAQSEMVKAIHTALDARRQRIVVSQSGVGTVKWAGILLQGLCTLVAIAMVHSDNRAAAGLALGLFSTAVAVCILLVVAHDRPFTGQLSIRPTALLQVQPESRSGNAVP